MDAHDTPVRLPEEVVSVFPTGSAANPTLTVAALSFRLATHLRERRS